ncbi:uncharacterized protein LOC125469153 [Pyrus x bretschneideri]|uniref:uncharacterized protein LOC125469153 n=1 Tax=Pyrus x bretschneideri TaxID=225117 RepID=UPI00202ED108|nr:uncharacterized protein LOC125469153 [Pyrus x bretschneideri]
MAMASPQNQSANLDLFHAYLRWADLDRDGRISGNEVVAFFQGSGHPNRSLRSFLFFTLKGFQQQQLMPGPGARHMARPAGGRSPKTVAPSHAEEKQRRLTQSNRIGETSCRSTEYRGG